MSSELEASKPYPTDTTRAQWRLVGRYVPAAKPGPNPQKHSRRRILDAILYKLRSGCSWRMLPHEYPPWQTVYWYMRAWIRSGVLGRINSELRGMVRRADGRRTQPTLAIIDSQSVKSANGGDAIGKDGNKKVHGRKRHILTDVMGLLICVVVTAANLHDTRALRRLVTEAREECTRLKKILVDDGYKGNEARRLTDETGIPIIATSKPEGVKGFVPVHKRWAVERSHGWYTHSRQLGREHDRLVSVAAAWVQLCFIAIMMHRLA